MTQIPRTERFALILSPPEHDGLRYLAEIEGLAEADVIRRLLRLAISDLPAEAKEAIGNSGAFYEPPPDNSNHRRRCDDAHRAD